MITTLIFRFNHFPYKHPASESLCSDSLFPSLHYSYQYYQYHHHHYFLVIFHDINDYSLSHYHYPLPNYHYPFPHYHSRKQYYQ